MRHLGLWCCVAVLAACGKGKEQPVADTTMAATPAAAPAAPAAPAPISLTDVAGKWNMRVMPANGDTTLVAYELVATGDSGWVFNFPKHKPVQVHVQASGDSIIAESAEYESVLRKGVKVKTNSVIRLVDGKLVGSTTARYSTKGADSVLQLRVEGTRAQ